MKKTKLFLLLLFVTLILFFGINIYIKKGTFIETELEEKNQKTIFSIDKITFFSSASSDIEISHNTSFNNLKQYTDIALFINNRNSSDELTNENTLKELYISNINFNTLPTLGTPNLFYKNINDFATNKYNSDQPINNSIGFNISSEDEIDYTTPTLYNNCANPISLTYVNSNIVDKYSIANTTNTFYYDGTLLKNCNILLSSINCSFSFDIFLTNNLNQKFKCPIQINIPLQNDSGSIYQGNIILEDNVNYLFKNCN